MSEGTKISPAFKGRLQDLTPGEKIRAIVLLRMDTSRCPPEKQRPHGDRSAAVEAVQASALQALEDVDRVLSATGEKRLTPHPNALGSIAVETTVGGIEALADLKQVKAILEDQRISLVR